MAGSIPSTHAAPQVLDGGTEGPDAGVVPGRSDTGAAAVLAILFVGVVALTWQRWTIPLMDHGREMNVPARILAGERLYIDIYYYYGPLAPYLNAALYAVFGVHLSVLHAAGMICAAWITAVTYWLSRQLLDVTGAALATALVLALGSLPYMGSYIQPYAYAALYGWTCALTALACAVRYVIAPRGRLLVAAGVLSGVAAGCKPEMGVLGIAPAILAWALSCYDRRRWSWRPLWQIGVPAAGLVLLIYGTLIAIVPWRFLVTQTYHSLSQPQMVYFAQGLSGVRLWPASGFAILVSLGLYPAICSATIVWSLVDRRAGRSPAGRWIVLTCGYALVACLIWRWGPTSTRVFDVAQPFRAMPLAIGLAALVWTWRFLARDEGKPSPRTLGVLLIIATFALAAITRVFLNVSILSPYTPFTVLPAAIVYTYLFLEAWPSRFPSHSRPSLAAASRSLLAAVVVSLLAVGIVYARVTRTTEVRTPRGTMRLDPPIGEPLGEAIRFAAANTAPGEAIATLPEGSVINFMADRPNPLHDENIMPGYVTPEREREMVRLIDEQDVPIILLLNRVTPEYRDAAFGIDYNQDLLRWIEANYRAVATFADQPAAGELRFGDRRFFIRAFERIPRTARSSAPRR